MATAPAAPASKRKLRTTLWVFSTYFIEGLPRTIVISIGTVFFTDLGVREALLGFINFFGIPWNLKFLWAPFLDIFSTKRSWMLRVQFILTILLFGIALLAGMHARAPSTSLLQAIAFLFVGFSFVAATNDIAIDAYYLEGLTHRDDQAAYSGLRVLAYRIAIIYARSVLLAIAGAANWFWGFSAGAATLFAFLLLHRFLLPRFEDERKRRRLTAHEVRSSLAESFLAYIRQKRFLLVICFLISYKLGDEFLFCMKTPFLMRELGCTKAQLSWLAGFVESFATIAGTLLGAWWIKRATLTKAIWPITLLMNVNIWAYVALAALRPQAATASGIWLIAAIHGYENIAAGLGTAALMIYLMRLCVPAYKAAHFAIGSAIMSLGATVFGGFGGIIVERIGYTNLFILAFFAALPAMALLPFVPMHESDPA